MIGPCLLLCGSVIFLLDLASQPLQPVFCHGYDLPVSIMVKLNDHAQGHPLFIAICNQRKLQTLPGTAPGAFETLTVYVAPFCPWTKLPACVPPMLNTGTAMTVVGWVALAPSGPTTVIAVPVLRIGRAH